METGVQRKRETHLLVLGKAVAAHDAARLVANGRDQQLAFAAWKE